MYVATLGRDGFWGFVNAGAEASMVGAIADWFAVTALFKHPLGLPIPHTALIPRRKDELGKGLEEFVGENFLQEDIIRERVAAATISARVGDWLSDPANARRVVDEVSDVAAIALGKVRDDHVADLVTQAFVPRFREEPIAPLLGTTLMEVLRDDLHHGVVDLVVEEMHRWLVDNPETFARVLGERAPWWAPPRLNDAVTTRIHVEAVAWVEDIRDDPHHRAREALDSMLGQLAHDLLNDAETQARAESFKVRLLDHPQVVTTAISLWKAMRAALLVSIRDREGAVRQRLLAELNLFAERLREDASLRERLDRRRRRPDRLPDRALRRRADDRHHAHHRALGRQGGRAPHRAARGPRPPVHPDQRHHRRRPGGRDHPRGQLGGRLRPALTPGRASSRA